MNKKSSKKITDISFVAIFLSVLLLFFVFINTVSAQQKSLEINYPTFGGIKPDAVNLPQYVKYIFNFFIAIVGLIAFGSLVYSGTRYLISSGKPEEIRKAKDRIKSTLLGLLLLLFSYLILITLNPYLTIFKLPKLIEIPYTPPPAPTPVPGPIFDTYERIKNLVNSLSAASGNIESQVGSLNSQVSQCDCSNALSACICGSKSGSGGGGGGGGFISGSLLGDFSKTASYLSGFQSSGLNTSGSFAPSGSSLSQFSGQLSGVSNQLFSGNQTFINSGQFSGAGMTNLSFSTKEASSFFGSSYQNTINQTPTYILNDSGYKNLINSYISQSSNQGLFANIQQQNLFSSQLLNTNGVYLYNGTEYLMALNGDSMIKGGTESFIRQFAYLTDGSIRQFSNSSQYLSIFNSALQSGSFVNNYSKIGGASEDFAQSLAYYYTYGIPEWISQNPTTQNSIRQRFDYFRNEGIVGDLQPDLEYLYEYSGTGQPLYGMPLSSSFDSESLQTNDQLISGTKTYVIGEFTNSERNALENGVNTAINYFNPQYRDLLKQSPTYIADTNEFRNVAEVYANKQYLQGAITKEQRDALVNRWVASTGDLTSSDGTTLINGDLLMSGQYSSAGAGPVSTAIHINAHRVDQEYNYSSSPEWTAMYNQSINYNEQQGSGGWVNNAAAVSPEEDFAWTTQAYYVSYGNPAYVSTDQYGNPPDSATQQYIQQRFDYLKQNEIINTQQWYY